MALTLGCNECAIVSPYVFGEFQHFSVQDDSGQKLSEWILFQCKSGDHWGADDFLSPKQTAQIGEILEIKYPESVIVIEQPIIESGDPLLPPMTEGDVVRLTHEIPVLQEPRNAGN